VFFENGSVEVRIGATVATRPLLPNGLENPLGSRNLTHAGSVLDKELEKSIEIAGFFYGWDDFLDLRNLVKVVELMEYGDIGVGVEQ
jgi:hypothetical protein